MALPLRWARATFVIFPHGDPYLMANGRPVTPVDPAKELEHIVLQELKAARVGAAEILPASCAATWLAVGTGARSSRVGFRLCCGWKSETMHNEGG
jgi:hypothetical protein